MVTKILEAAREAVQTYNLALVPSDKRQNAEPLPSGLAEAISSLFSFNDERGSFVVSLRDDEIDCEEIYEEEYFSKKYLS